MCCGQIGGLSRLCVCCQSRSELREIVPLLPGKNSEAGKQNLKNTLERVTVDPGVGIKKKLNVFRF